MADRIPLTPQDFNQLLQLARDPRTSLSTHTARALSSHGLIAWTRGQPTNWTVTTAGHAIASRRSPVYQTYGDP